MSVRVMSWAWAQRIEDAGAKLVLLKLADSANDDGVSWPSKKTLAKDCEINARNIRHRLKRLEELGLLRVEERRRPNGSQASNLYYLLMEGVVRDIPPVQPTTSLGVSPATSLEPSVEPSERTMSRKRDVVWDEVAAELEEPTNEQSRGKRNRAVKLIRESLQALYGGDEQNYHREIRARCRRYRELFPEVALTDMALANQWDALAPASLGRAWNMDENVVYPEDWTEEQLEESKQRLKEMQANVLGDMQLTVDGREVPHDEVIEKTRKEA